MTDPDNQTSTGAYKSFLALGRGFRLAFAASVAVNLAVLGVVAGLWLDGGPGPHGDMMVREMGFGPFDEALRPQDRAALKKLVLAQIGDLRTTRQQMQTDATAILAALRATPFDAALLQSALDGQAQNLQARIKLGSGLIATYLTSLTSEDRLDFADRLEEHMHHGHNAGDEGAAKAPAGN